MKQFVTLVPALTLLTLLNMIRAEQPLGRQPPTLEDELKNLVGIWEPAQKDPNRLPIRLHIFSIKEGKAWGELAVTVPGATVVFGCTFRLVEKEKKRFIEAESAAFKGKESEKVFPYLLRGDRLILQGGIADEAMAIGVIVLKGEWKRVQVKK